MNTTVARCRAIAASSDSGEVRSSSSVEAPTRIGKHSMPPRPKVNASGGVPQKTSSACVRSTDRGNRSHIASTSRWTCIVPLGWPVVPEVKAISATSSCAVSQPAKLAGLAAARASSEPARAPPTVPSPSSNHSTCASDGHSACARRISSARRASHSAAVTRARSITGTSSRARSSGIVATATSPHLTTASQHAAIIGEFGPRSSTRLPGTSARSSTSTRQIRSTCACSCR